MSTLLIIAKAPDPGRVKTRLCPPCTATQAAALAEAALADTLQAGLASGASRRMLVLDGRPGEWLPAGFEVVAQRGRGLAERLASAFEDAWPGPALLVGMDTPQVTPELLDDGLARLVEPGIEAVLGGAHDGGYWALGLRRPDRRALCGVPMSVASTAQAQRARLRELDLGVHELPALRDVDRFEDALAVAASAPSTRFAARLAATVAALAAV